MDFYKLLEVDRDASPEVINKAYKALAMKYHPDKYPECERAAADDKMRQLNEAYGVLSDPGQRLIYDANRLYWRVWLNDGLIGLFKAWRTEI